MEEVATVIALLERYGYLLVFLAGVAEALPLVGLLVPGQAVILLAGAVSASGHLNVWLVFVAAFPAGIIGDAVSYYIGRRHGRPLLERYGPRMAITERHLQRSEALFAKYGIFALILARFSFLTRGIGPMLAGISKMRQVVFWPLNIGGAFLWAAAYTMLGYFSGAAYFRVESILGRILTWTAVGVIGLYLLYRVLNKYAEHFTREDFYISLLGISGGTVFGVLADRVDKLGRLNHLDRIHAPLHDALQPARGVLAWLEPLGSYPAAGFIALGLLVWLAWRRRAWEAALCGLGIGGVLLLTETLRRVFTRTLEPETVGGTFPGANAAVAVVLAGVVVYIFAYHARHVWQTLAVALGAGALAFAVGIAPIARLVEFPTDVPAGFALGVTWLSVSILLVEFALKRAPRV